MTWESVQQKLTEANAPALVSDLFKVHYNRLSDATDSFVRETDISAVEDVVDAERLDDSLASIGASHLPATAVLKLNGGLGTGMGLEGPKSLLQVKGQDSFLAFILRQASRLSVPLVLMNSFSTDAATASAIQDLGVSDVQVISFLQHQVPKIDAATLAPVSWPDEPALQWCPPGHGDIYAALVTSGTLDRLLAEGRRYVFVSNADNLGATLDLKILGHFIQSGKSFLMEVADRTAADRKGGHLARAADGRLILREKAQCHPDDEMTFQDYHRHRFFNTNNLWIDLQALADYLQDNGDGLVLPTIVNRKTVDPKDASSSRVFQLETAMGAAIEVLPNTDAVRIPRSRFAPVKTTSDLLAVRSDAYEIREDSSVGLIAERNGIPPEVVLDDRFYKKISDLEARIPTPPSLSQCDRLEIVGDVRFSQSISVRGRVKIMGAETGSELASGSYDSDVDLAQ